MSQNTSKFWENVQNKDENIKETFNFYIILLIFQSFFGFLTFLLKIKLILFVFRTIFSIIWSLLHNFENKFNRKVKIKKI